MITGSLVRSSQAAEYSVSKLGRTTSRNEPGGKARMCANWFIGPNPGRASASKLIETRRGMSISTSGEGEMDASAAIWRASSGDTFRGWAWTTTVSGDADNNSKTAKKTIMRRNIVGFLY